MVFSPDYTPDQSFTPDYQSVVSLLPTDQWSVVSGQSFTTDQWSVISGQSVTYAVIMAMT